VGHALITMVEPHAGYERIYNRWYEDDHFFAGALFAPWMFSGKRWVATRDLQLMRYPKESAVANPVTAGCYLGVYWVTEGRVDDHKSWIFKTNDRLRQEGRSFVERTHVFTSFQDKATTVYRDTSVVRDVHALNHGYAGLVLEVVDAPTAETRADLERWLVSEHIPSVLTGGAAAMCGVFLANPQSAEGLPASQTKESTDKMMSHAAAGGRRITLLWFLEEDPRTCWHKLFRAEGEKVQQGGKGRLELVAPFIPSIMGTDRYIDELR
jgi:hypothetical protein